MAGNQIFFTNGYICLLKKLKMAINYVTFRPLQVVHVLTKLERSNE